MLKSIISKTGEGILPTLGGIGGGLGVWWETYNSVVWSAAIFAIVGGILGFLIGKLMQWIWKCITKEK